MAQVLIIGAGRAGSSMARALREVGHEVEGPVGRGFHYEEIDDRFNVVMVATSDDAIASVSSKIPASPKRVVVHLSGSLGLDVLNSHPRRGALHPLVPLPTVELGSHRLLSGISFAVAGDEIVQEIVTSLHGNIVAVADEDRARYHAAACVAANHVVAVMGQVERIAESAGLSVDAFLDLARAAIDDVARFGARNALTGPASRGDWATLERHLDAIDASEHAGYRAGVGMALDLITTRDVIEVLDEPVDEMPEVRSPSGTSLVG